MSEEAKTEEVDSAEQPKVEPKQEIKVAAPISITGKGFIEAKDSSEEYRIAKIFLDSGAVPSMFKNPAQVMMAMQFLKRFAMDPVVCIRQVCIINGSLSIWGELPLGLVRRFGTLEIFEEFFFDKNYKTVSFENKNLDSEIWGASCLIKMQGSSLLQRAFTRDDAERARLWDKSIWKLYPNRMLQMRTRSWALKDAAPEIIGGVSILEYDHNMLMSEDGKLIENKSSAMEQMQKMLGENSQP